MRRLVESRLLQALVQFVSIVPDRLVVPLWNRTIFALVWFKSFVFLPHRVIFTCVSCGIPILRSSSISVMLTFSLTIWKSWTDWISSSFTIFIVIWYGSLNILTSYFGRSVSRNFKKSKFRIVVARVLWTFVLQTSIKSDDTHLMT